MTVVLNMYLYLLAAQASYSRLTFQSMILTSSILQLLVHSKSDRGDAVENIRVDLKTSTMKPIHFHWPIENHSWLAEQDSALIRGWKEAGILECFATN